MDDFQFVKIHFLHVAPEHGQSKIIGQMNVIIHLDEEYA